jgi:hypothetical protein
MVSLLLRQIARSASQTGVSTRRRTGHCSLTSSSVQGPTERSLDIRTLTGFFREEVIGKHAHRPALICRQERPRAHGGPLSRNLNVTSHLAWDFDEFDKHIRALARGLVAMGVRKGDRVAVLMGNNRWRAVWALTRGIHSSRVYPNMKLLCITSVGVREHRRNPRNAEPCLQVE